MKTKTDKQIDEEIAKLEKNRNQSGQHAGFRYNSSTREMIAAQISVLRDRMTEPQIENKWYSDETAEEYQDGGNEIYHEAMRAKRWMEGDEHESAPSEEA